MRLFGYIISIWNEFFGGFKMEIKTDLIGSCFKNGYKVLENKGLAIIGMSPGNSYFKQQTIHDLIAFTAQRFTLTYIWIPDIPAEHTYKALGYTALEAQRKARQKGNNLRNHSKRAIEALSNYSLDNKCLIMDWNTDIESNKVYQEKFKYVQKLYSENLEFCNDVQSETKRVLDAYPHKKESTSKNLIALNEGTQYLLKELAFFLAAQKILNNSQITLLYHQRWPVFEKFFSGYYDGMQNSIGLIIIK